VAAVGFALIVKATSAVVVQRPFVMVQRKAVTVPEVCVKVAPGVVAFGLNVPAPPPMMLHAPVPTPGVLPPRAAVVPVVQIVCEVGETDAVVGGTSSSVTVSVCVVFTPAAGVPCPPETPVIVKTTF